MRFDFSISIGNIVTFAALLGGIWRVEKFLRSTQSLLQKFSIEHEILIQDYCKRNQIDLNAFPTRMKGLL
jgi:hypothetical protein